MIQQKSDAMSSAAASNTADSSSDDDDFPDDDFSDEETVDTRPALNVSSVDTLFSDNIRSSGALVAGKKSKPDRISLRSVSDKEDDDRLNNEYGLSPTKRSSDSSDGFRLPIAKIKTLFDATASSDVRYHHLGPPTFQRNTSSSSQNTGNLVDLELAPSQRQHAAEIPRADWDLSKTAWSSHIPQSQFDNASSRPMGDWEAPSNDSTYQASKWNRNTWMRSKNYYKSPQFCWWFWQIVVAVAGVVFVTVLVLKSRS